MMLLYLLFIENYQAAPSVIRWISKQLFALPNSLSCGNIIWKLNCKVPEPFKCLFKFAPAEGIKCLFIYAMRVYSFQWQQLSKTDQLVNLDRYCFPFDNDDI